MGHEEEIGTNNFHVVELDLLLCISAVSFIHSFIQSPSPMIITDKINKQLVS